MINSKGDLFIEERQNEIVKYIEKVEKATIEEIEVEYSREKAKEALGRVTNGPPSGYTTGYAKGHSAGRHAQHRNDIVFLETFLNVFPGLSISAQALLHQLKQRDMGTL